MKLRTLTLLPLLAVLTSINIFGQTSETDYSLAKVGKKIYGVYIFLNSEPYNEYDYIATVDVKITWTGSQQESFEKAINKAKKKHPYFNGMVFHSSDFDKVDLIRFKGLDVSRGGVSIDSKVSFIQGNQVNYGIVVELQSSNGEASVMYFDIFEEEKVKKLAYTDLTPLSDEIYLEKQEEFKKEVEKYKFNIGDKVIWTDNKMSAFGEVMSLDHNYHKASIKYINTFGEEIITKVSYLDLNSITEEDFIAKLNSKNEEVEQHTFEMGQKVTWIKSDFFGQNPKQISGEIIELNDTYHKASVKYIDENKEEKIEKVSYVDLSKIKP